MEPAPNSHGLSANKPAFEDAVRSRLSDALEGIAESADPVAGLETAVQQVAQELSRDGKADQEAEPAGTPGEEIGHAIETLVNVALETDDPVAALEEGAESLAEALAARDAAAEEWLRAAQERQIDDEGAYRHARLHRVTELIDVGYSLDQAVAITNADEAEIRARAAVVGRDPMEPIYQYAVLNGYRGAGGARSTHAVRSDQSGPARPSAVNRHSSAVEALAGLGDEAFAEATKGDRWERLMRP